LSSISGITGSRAQANYAMANTFQDGVARQLAGEGRACLSLNLGSVLSFGFAAEHDLTASLRRRSAHHYISKTARLGLPPRQPDRPRLQDGTARFWTCRRAVSRSQPLPGRILGF
jgi:hypothetical protein